MSLLPLETAGWGPQLLDPPRHALCREHPGAPPPLPPRGPQDATPLLSQVPARRAAPSPPTADTSLGETGTPSTSVAKVDHPAAPSPASCAPGNRGVFRSLWTLETERLSTCLAQPSTAPGHPQGSLQLQTPSPGRVARGPVSWAAELFASPHRLLSSRMTWMCFPHLPMFPFIKTVDKIPSRPNSAAACARDVRRLCDHVALEDQNKRKQTALHALPGVRLPQQGLCKHPCVWS